MFAGCCERPRLCKLFRARTECSCSRYAQAGVLYRSDHCILDLCYICLRRASCFLDAFAELGNMVLDEH